ncbi:hypothetical protein [Streptococcus agalactiae]|uniref:hypothetical protein n=1 Tax=Streptococcus agalactiae TaxID=1311 RepID=UPI003C76F4EB
MQHKLLKISFIITCTELILCLIAGAYIKLSYSIAPPKEPSMGDGYGMLFAMLFIPISCLILLAIIQFLAYQSQSKIIAIIVLLLFSSHYWQILDGLSL